MVIGGVPYYLSLLDPKKNVPDNIDALFFSAEAELEGEFGGGCNGDDLILVALWNSMMF
jgi:hypothetical protein